MSNETIIQQCLSGCLIFSSAGCFVISNIGKGYIKGGRGLEKFNSAQMNNGAILRTSHSYNYGFLIQYINLFLDWILLCYIIVDIGWHVNNMLLVIWWMVAGRTVASGGRGKV